MRVIKGGDSDEPAHTLSDGDWLPCIEAATSGAGAVAIHFQPIVELQRGDIAGYETLARFAGPPAASPDRWFATASRLGRGFQLEACTVQLSLAHLATLPGNAFLTVNISPAFLASPHWRELVDRHGRLDRVVVELTEHATVHDYQPLHRALDHLRSLGGFVAIDDAGSGYASLQHIMRLRPDFIKIDRAFIDGCADDPPRIALIEAVGSLAARLDAWVIAEGVETDADLQTVTRLGVPLAQGFLLGRPQPAMAEVREDIATAIRAQHRRQADKAVTATLVQPFVTVTTGSRNTPRARLTLMLHPDGRPSGWAGPGLPVRGARPLLVKSDTPLRALAQRAMSRTASSRFIPAVCTDAEGRYIGVVRMEDLLTFLARER